VVDATDSKGDVPDVLARILEVFADLIAKRCAALLGAVSASEYTSKNLPGGMSRRTFNDRCKRLADLGDRRVRRRGRQWVAARDAIDETPARRRAPAKVFGGPCSPQAALEAAGVRAQRK
jgi:hypothetical protein